MTRYIADVVSTPRKTDLLCYWPWDKLAHDELRQVHVFAHDCSDKFRGKGLEDGDKTVWYVTVPKQFRTNLDGVLCLMGRLEVSSVTYDHAAASSYIKQTYQHNYPIRQSEGPTPLHLLAREGTAEPYVLVPIGDLVPILRFVSQSSDRLQLDAYGRLSNMQQLQSVRWLTADSIHKLEARWERRQVLDRWRSRG